VLADSVKNLEFEGKYIAQAITTGVIVADNS